MSRSVMCGVALGLGATLALQGCGGSGDSSGPTSTVTTTPVPTAPGGLRWCEPIDTFYKVVYDDQDTKSAVGQCLPSLTPGAYYTKPGQKGDDDKSDRSWSCFSPDFDRSLWTDAEAQARDPPFEGACLFKDYDSKATPADVEDCSKHLSHHPSVCAPGPTTFWGACWSSRSENWKCIPKGDGTIAGLAKGDCKAGVLLGPESSVPTKYFYDGACRFEAEAAKLYKCDTVPDYHKARGGTCGRDVDHKSSKACFSLKSGVQWECIEEGTDFPSPCDWTLLPDGSKEYYTGACVFPNDKNYADALDAHNLTTSSLIV